MGVFSEFLVGDEGGYGTAAGIEMGVNGLGSEPGFEAAGDLASGFAFWKAGGEEAVRVHEGDL